MSILDLFRRKPEQPKPPRLVIKEGVDGYFVYHMAFEDQNLSLCGKRVMRTSLPNTAWGTKTHLNEKWCTSCAKQSSP